MSKMAAFRAGTYRDRDSFTGPQTRVPISAFLEDNGFVPSRPRAPQRGATAGPSTPNLASQGPLGAIGRDSAPVADMGMGSAFAGANGLPTPASGQSFKTNMTPEPMLASIEGDVPMADATESLGRLQIEVGHLRTMCQSALASNTNIHEYDLRNIQAEMGIQKADVRDLGGRVSQLEGMVHALQNTSLGGLVDRVNELEGLVEDLRSKVGSGCDAEVAKMREVMGALKSGLDKVGGFV